MLSFKDTLKLKEVNLDQEDIDYISTFPSLHTAWEESKTSRWMLNYLKYLDNLTRKQWVELALAFAERALPIFEAKYPNDSRPREAIEAVKHWLENPSEENRELCEKTAANAYAAAYAAAAAAAAAAVDAAAYAAYAVAAAADVAYAATNAAFNAAYAVYANANAAYANANNNKLERLEQARIIRSKVPNPFMPEHERLGLDKDTAEPWKDILEEL